MNIGMEEDKVGRKPGRKPAKKEVEEQKKTVVYYCTKGMFSFSINEYERDEFEKYVLDEQKNRKKLFVADADGNNRHAVMIQLQFNRLPIIDKKTGKPDATKNYGQLVVEADNERYDDIIAAIEKARKNPLNGIMNHDEFGKHENEAEYKQQIINNRLKNENKDLKNENDVLKEKLRKQGISID